MSNRHRPSKLANSSIFVIVAAGAIPISGCATVKSGDYGVVLDDTGHPGNSAPESQRLRISAGEHGALSSAYFGVVEVTFENNTSAWIQIDHIDLDFGSAEKNKSVFIPWDKTSTPGKRPRSKETRSARPMPKPPWRLSRSLEPWRRPQGGTTPPASSGNPSPSARWRHLAQERSAAVEATRIPTRFPSTHLLTMPLRLPPGLFAERWLLLSTPLLDRPGVVSTR